MRYYYLHPFRVQYFFPREFRDYDLFSSFFKPFTTRGAISWWLFVHVWPYRVLFGKSKIESYIPEDKIRQLTGDKSVLAFNTGTQGPGQKVTGLGLLNNKEFFFKYAEKKYARKLVSNEADILNQLKAYDFVPTLKDYHEDSSGVFLKTSVLKGERLACKTLDERFMKRLLEVSKIQVKAPIHRTGDTTLKTSFAHGDFCPWNMIEYQNGLFNYDWEMAGIYPLGYDLFTFIFQTNFLNKPDRKVSQILQENTRFIRDYFDYFFIDDWSRYLMGYVEIKIWDNRRKEGSILQDKLRQLRDYAAST